MERRIFVRWIAALVVVTILGCITLFFSNSVQYNMIFFMPLSYGLGLVIFNRVFRKIFSNIGLMFIEILFFIRMVIIPFVITLAMQDNPISYGVHNTNKAIALQCYEFFIVHFAIFVVLCIKHNQSNNKKEIIYLYNPGNLAATCIIGLTLFVVAVWIFIPSSRELYSSVFHFSDADFTTVTYSTASESVGSASRSILTLFKMAFDIVRILFPLYLMIKIRQKMGYRRLGLGISLFLCFLQLLFIPSTTARAIISAFLLLYFTTKIYPEFEKKLMVYAVLGTVSIIVFYFYVRFSVGSRYGNDGLIYIKNILTAYFGGLDNIAAGFNIITGHEVKTFFGSLYSAIPFNSTLFGLKVESLQEFYNLANNSYGQITPMISEGYYYFGFVFAPIFSVFFALIAYKFGEKQRTEINPWLNICYLFIAIMSAISIVMYNEQIIVVWFTNWLIPMTIIALMTRRNKKNEKDRHNYIAQGS